MGMILTNAGLMTLPVSDGHGRVGTSLPAPMDMRSYWLANILAANNRSEPALEITYLGPEIRFTEDQVIALTGGNIAPMLNGFQVPMYRAIPVRSGDVLSFGKLQGRGCRVYLAMHGGMKIKKEWKDVWDSEKAAYENRLSAGDEIQFRAPEGQLPDIRDRAVEIERFGSKTIKVRVLPFKSAKFSRGEIRKFFQQRAEITNYCDRTGYRLEIWSPLRRHAEHSNYAIESEFGLVQVTDSGQPLILMADRPKFSEYSSLGVVLPVDLPLIAQALPGNEIDFINADEQTQEAVMAREKERLDEIEEKLNGN